MDDIVKAALKKWPNVPHCYGWLALDARGDWYMRDDRIQARGPFPQVKGSRIQHEKLREFIERNYAATSRQLVLPERAAARLRRARGGAVGLAACRRRPSAASCAATPALRGTSTALARRARAALPRHRLGFGIVHTLDMEVAARRSSRAPGSRGDPLRRLPQRSAIG
jgi:hypothetical protein